MKLAFLLLAVAPAAAAQVRVEPRLLVKEQHLFLSGGFSWLARGDYYNSPGAVLSAAWYPKEDDAVELRAAAFVAFLNDSANRIFQGTGFVPDSQKPSSLIMLGWRHSLTYGKVALGSSVLHFDFQSGLHGGILVTDRSLQPALSASVGLLARISNRFYSQLDVALVGSREQRSTAVFAAGVLPMLTVGVSL